MVNEWKIFCFSFKIFLSWWKTNNSKSQVLHLCCAWVSAALDTKAAICLTAIVTPTISTGTVTGAKLCSGSCSSWHQSCHLLDCHCDPNNFYRYCNWSWVVLGFLQLLTLKLTSADRHCDPNNFYKYCSCSWVVLWFLQLLSLKLTMAWLPLRPHQFPQVLQL